MMEPPSSNITPVDQSELRQTLSQNISVSLLTNILYLVTRLFIPPFILRYVSLEDYGLWSYCFILISYLGMSVFGVTNVYVRYAAVYAAKGEVDKINRLISTGILSVSSLCLVLIPILYFGIPQLFAALNVSASLYATAFFLIFGTMLIFMIDLTAGAFGYVLQSLQKIAVERFIWTTSYLIETACIILFLMNGYGVYGLLYAFLLRTLTAIVLYMFACYRVLPGLNFSFRNFDKKMLKDFFHFGGIVQVSGMLGVLNRSLEKLLAGFFISLEATGLYELGEKFPVMALMLPGAINTAFLPASAHMHAHERQGHIQETYVQMSRLINLITGAMMGFMAAFAPPLIIAWLGTDERFHPTMAILAWFTWAYQMDVLTGPASAIYRSIGKPLREWMYGILQLALVLAAALSGFALFGASIPVINVTVATMMGLSAFLYILWSNHFLKVDQRHYFKEAFLPGLIFYLIGFGLYFSMSTWFEAVSQERWSTFYLLLLGNAFYVAIVSPLYYFFILKQDEKEWLRQRWQRILPKNKKK